MSKANKRVVWCLFALILTTGIAHADVWDGPEGASARVSEPVSIARGPGQIILK
jgi:hypothetical protein